MSMYKLLSLILLCGSLSAFSADRITAIITVTNTPSAADSLTVNASVRTWVASVATPSSEVLIGASAGASATNLWNQVIRYPFTGITPSFSSSNVITLRGQTGAALASSLSGTWASLTLSTQSMAQLKNIRVPFSAEPTVSVREGNADQLITDLSTYATTPFVAGSDAISSLVQTTGDQTIDGAKTFNSGTVLSNTVSMHFAGTSGATAADSTTNGIVFTLGPAGSGTNTHWVISGNELGEPQIVDSGGNSPTSFPETPGGIITYQVLIDRFPRLTGASNETNVWDIHNAFTDLYAINSTLTNWVALAGGATNVVLTNSFSSGALTIQGDIALTDATVGTLANGNNANLDFGIYSSIILTTGPTAAFAINGIQSASKAKLLYIYNATGQNMTIANDSGVDPTPANRIYTMTGGDRATTAEGSVTLKYLPTLSRWIIVGFEQ